MTAAIYKKLLLPSKCLLPLTKNKPYYYYYWYTKNLYFFSRIQTFFSNYIYWHK